MPDLRGRHRNWTAIAEEAQDGSPEMAADLSARPHRYLWLIPLVEATLGVEAYLVE